MSSFDRGCVYLLVGCRLSELVKIRATVVEKNGDPLARVAGSGFRAEVLRRNSFRVAANLFIAALEPFSMADESYSQEKVTSWNWGSKIRSFL